ncbi:MAG TPA: metallophosphoesterase, partial [Anaerovoracaceae bacterium]|nr:metallophosphoesterase [Anaerovoracaceae bacterium]
MSLYAIGDLHLSFGGSVDKPMDIFGRRWENHTASIETFWNDLVSEQDTVVIPGDISWGMTLEQSAPDFDFLERLPGRKIILKGNHDY